MSEISNIGITNSVVPTYRTLPAAPVDGVNSDGVPAELGEADPVEFSRMGRILASALENSSLRQARIQAIRTQIAEGTFETPERIAGTVDRLIRDLR
jgi:hypothetical protein